MTMTGNDRFCLSLFSIVLFLRFLLFAIKFRQKINRTYCITATYSLSRIES